MRLRDVVERDPAILFSPYVDEFRTMASFNPRGRLVVNAGHALDHEVLLTLPQVMPGVTVTRVYPASEIAALSPPPAHELGGVLLFEQRATGALADLRCDVVVRRFPSADLPAVLIGRGRIDVASAGYGDLAHLVVNWDNRAVRALVRTPDDLVFDRVVQLLYVQARMAGHHDGTAVGGHDRIHDGQAEAGALAGRAGVPGPPGLAAGEPLEQFGQQLGRDAGTVVGDAQLHPRALRSDAALHDRGAVRRDRARPLPWGEHGCSRWRRHSRRCRARRPAAFHPMRRARRRAARPESRLRPHSPCSDW